jgi:transposase-like protein
VSALYDFRWSPSVDDVDVVVDALLDAYTTPSSLARVLGVGRPTVYDWRKGATPRPDVLARMRQLHAHLTGWDDVA